VVLAELHGYKLESYLPTWDTVRAGGKCWAAWVTAPDGRCVGYGRQITQRQAATTACQDAARKLGQAFTGTLLQIAFGLFAGVETELCA
jgi:hypothetical protein